MSDAHSGLMTVFGEALERADPADRAAYLDRACGADAALRVRVEALLVVHAGAGRFLEPDATSAFDATSPGPTDATGAFPPDAATGTFASADPEATATYSGRPPARRPAASGREGNGTVIAGRYTLVEVIGEGGMGSVYLASQSEPVKRQVALKLIKAGMDSKAVLARFDAERQALALMDHPNIARIYDGGVTPAGQPFFVMELVQGVPLTAYCDTQRLTIDARLLLFVQVCQAVQHAHQKGIIHRDLKPGNVLVTEVDGRPTPKVIDFGVAKATELRLTEMSFSDVGAIVGTPAYMSPEQADPSSMDIDTRTDVYALGVMLYELLTGSPPIDSKQFKRWAILEMLRMVREVEPPRPSTRLSEANARPNVAANRSIDPAKLAKLLQGELDWVVMKALEKDRTRRYETANGLARDLQRYLADEVVEARPPSRGYRLKKFVKRNKGQVIAASLVLLTLVAGVIGTTLGLIEANAAAEKERTATATAQAARTAAENAEVKERAAKVAAEGSAAKEKTAKEQEATQRAAAETARDRTRDVLDAMVSEVTGDSLATQKEISPEQKKFLESVLGYYREFAGENPDDERSRARHALAASRVATIEYRLGRNKEAAAAERVALTSYSSLAADFPAEPAYLQRVALCHTHLGMLLVALGQHEAAKEQYLKALSILEKHPGIPGSADYLSDLAGCHNQLGKLFAGLGQRAAAEKQYRKALAIQEKLANDFPTVPAYRLDLAASRNNLGMLLASHGEQAAAEEQLRKALAIQEKLVADFPAVRGYRSELAMSHCNLGLLLAGLGQRAAAEEQYRKALAINEKLAVDFPNVPSYRRNLAINHHNLALLFADHSERGAAEEQWRKALAIQEKLVEDFPAVPTYRAEQALSHASLGILFAEFDKRPQAQEQYRKALAIQEKLVADFPLVPEYREDLAKCHGNLGIQVAALGKPVEAAEQYRKALAIREKLVKDFPAVPAYRRDLASSHTNLGVLLTGLGKPAEAVEQFSKCLAILEKLADENPTVPAYRFDLAQSHGNLGEVFADLGKPVAAEEQYRKGLAIEKKLVDDFPTVSEFKVSLGGSYGSLGNLVRIGGDPAESLKWYGLAIDCLQPIHTKEPDDVTAKQFLLNSLRGRAEAHDQLQKFAAAVKDWDRAIEISPPVAQPQFRANRAKSRLNAGMVSEAMAEVAELTKTPTWNANQWYYFASMYSMASSKIADKRQEYSDRAMELLQKAVKAGYKDAKHIRKNTDLDPLRERDDFKKLMAELEAKFPPKTEPAPKPPEKK